MRLVLDSFLAMNTYRRRVPNVVIAAAYLPAHRPNRLQHVFFFCFVTKTDDHDGWKTSIQTSFAAAAAAAAVGDGWN
jgi:hypothetical protein